MKHLDILQAIDLVGQCGSIRQAAARLGLIPSGLTRRIQAFEGELGSPVLDRLPHGVRLNEAGEMLVRLVRTHAADFERLRSDIADLSGERRGHVRLACSQAFADHVLPDEIGRFRAGAPGITFDVKVRDHAQGVAALASLEADLAVLVGPPPAPDMQVLLSGQQPLCAIMHRDHPVARRAAAHVAGRGTARRTVRLRDCLAHPVAMPDASLAVRRLLDEARVRLALPLNMRLECGSIGLLLRYVLCERLISFQLSTGLPPEVPDLCVIPIARGDIPPVPVVMGQAKGRTLSIAAMRFVEQFARHPLWSKRP